jgi:hypothetical protein
MIVLAACGSSPTDAPVPPAPPPPPPANNGRTLPDTIALQPFVDSIRTLMPGRGSNGYRPPSNTDADEMAGLLARARAGDVSGADSIANLFRYDVEATVDAVHGDSLVVIVERTPVERGWGTYVLRQGGMPMNVHVNHPIFDGNTPRVAAALYDACRCRALLMAGTHRDANPDDVSDMARSTTSVFQRVHEMLADDADMVVSVHGFARENHDTPIRSSDAVLSLGADLLGDLAADNRSRALRDALRVSGFIVGLVADDADYDALTGSPNPQGRYSNSRFGHGRWIHMELANEVRTDSAAWGKLTMIVAGWLAGGG